MSGNDKLCVTVLAFAASCCVVLPASAQLQPFQLEVKQAALFGRTDTTLLQGGISDTIYGALLRTKQENASGSRILKPRFAADLSDELNKQDSGAVAELTPLRGLRVDLPGRQLLASVDLAERQKVNLAELVPKTAPLQPLLPMRARSAPKDLDTRLPAKIDLERAPLVSQKALEDLVTSPKGPVDLKPGRASVPVDLQAKRGTSLGDLKTVESGAAEVDLVPRAKRTMSLDVAPKVALELPSTRTNAVTADLEPTKREPNLDEPIARTQLTPKLQLPPKADFKPDLLQEPKVKAQLVRTPKRQREPELKPKPVHLPKPMYEPKPVAVPKRQDKVVRASIEPVSKVTPLSAKQQQKVLWDEWYERVGQACDARLVTELKRCGNPIGSCTVQLSVREDHSVGVVSIERNGEAFSDAAVSAYRALDGSHVWEFPRGTKRKGVRFNVRNKQTEQGVIVDVDAERIHGESEIIEPK